MTLTFTQENGMYVAEFKVSGNFNLHIEKSEIGFMSMGQRSIETGSFVAVKDFDFNGQVIDSAVISASGVFPMWFRIESKSEITIAEVVSNSEVEQIPIV